MVETNVLVRPTDVLCTVDTNVLVIPADVLFNTDVNVLVRLLVRLLVSVEYIVEKKNAVVETNIVVNAVFVLFTSVEHNCSNPTNES